MSDGKSRAVRFLKQECAGCGDHFGYTPIRIDGEIYCNQCGFAKLDLGERNGKDRKNIE